MGPRITIAYNKPETARYSQMGEAIAILGVLECVHAVEKALNELGYEAILLPLSPPGDDIKPTLARLETKLIFNLFEGFEDSSVTEMLVPEAAEELGIPYTGCPSTTLRAALDKAKAKAMMKSAGIRTSGYQVLTPTTVDEFNLSYPCIVKPRSEDASHGLTEASVVSDAEALKKQVELVSAAYGGDALVEEFIDGREFNSTGMGNINPVVLPISEIVYSLPDNLPRLLTFAAKWEEDSVYFRGTTPVCPANLTAAQRRQVAQIVVKTFNLFGCRGYARVDLRMDSKGSFYVIELNPNPDITPGNGTARHAEATGMSYTEFINKIVQLALERSYEYTGNPAYAPNRQTSGDGDSTRYARIPAP
ncbi:MAG: ATP-grasp domain-containing protein [Dehalococcoidia bacterium]|nr:ATP-grasp domain-containing protein [Dehalococcoidia bacterium]